jgi:DNA-binding transcriptional MerR regulator
MEDPTALFTIGQLARRTGLPVRTIRYWSDIGAVPPAKRTSSGRRQYDPSCLARLELVATLRELGLGLADVRRVLENQATVAGIAAVHAEALGAQIRTLRLRRAVLATVAKRAADATEMTLMNKLANLTAAERKQIIDDFVAEVFRGLDPDPGLDAHLRMATPDLSDDPSPEQVDAWVELAELVQDPTSAGASARWPGTALRHKPAAVYWSTATAASRPLTSWPGSWSMPDGHRKTTWTPSRARAPPCWTASWRPPRMTSAAGNC